MKKNIFWAEKLGVADLKENNTVKILSREYICKNRMLREKKIYSKNQSQTKRTFGFKWKKRDTYESKTVQDFMRGWLVDKYLGGKDKLLDKWLPDDARLLDAGCGAGFSALLLFERRLKDIHYLGVDISDSIDIAAQRFKEKGANGEFLQADLMHLPFSKPEFDVIFSEGVLHHTDSTERSFKYLAKLIRPGGRFIFYVYRQKSPIREYSDDYIRSYLKKFNEKESWEMLMPLTKLGKALGDMNIKVNVPQEIPFLGIPAGHIDLQRLFYWYIFKAFYRKDFSITEMNHINFDWYRPLNCHRQTPEQIKGWCLESGLKIDRMNVEEAGISCVAVKI